MNLAYTRAMVQAALSGELDRTETVKDDIFGLDIPLHVPGVPDDVLTPKKTWADSVAYKATALKLAAQFKEKLQKKFKNGS
ncbi:hypothetical protein GCM10020331_030140 [Ectobacillus funiculus]